MSPASPAAGPCSPDGDTSRRTSTGRGSLPARQLRRGIDDDDSAVVVDSWSYSAHLDVDPAAARAQFLARRANAVIIMLARNKDLIGAVTSIQQIEDRFNKRFNYPWVFLGEVPFTRHFKA